MTNTQNSNDVEEETIIARELTDAEVGSLNKALERVHVAIARRAKSNRPNHILMLVSFGPGPVDPY